MTSATDIGTTTTTAPAALAIGAQGLTRSFREVRAVDHVDLAVAAGAVFGLLGPDGAGKSTLIRMLATVLRADEGDAEVFGESVMHRARFVTPRIGYMSQKFSMYPDLTVAENLDFFATIRGVPAAERRERAASLLESMGLSEFAGRQAQHLSGGMRQKLMLATTLMHEPELLLLDEPTTGVDPVSRREFWRIIATLHRAGKTVLVATPYMDEAERCTDVAFMAEGRIIHHGTPAQIKSLIPGHLFEVGADDPREALAVLSGTAGVASAHLLGEFVRVLSAPHGPDADELAARLDAAGIAGTSVRPTRVDMEAAFAFLAEQGDMDAAVDQSSRAVAEERGSL